jgi:hypothetical protein
VEKQKNSREIFLPTTRGGAADRNLNFFEYLCGKD